METFYCAPNLSKPCHDTNSLKEFYNTTMRNIWYNDSCVRETFGTFCKGKFINEQCIQKLSECQFANTQEGKCALAYLQSLIPNIDRKIQDICLDKCKTYEHCNSPGMLMSECVDGKCKCAPNRSGKFCQNDKSPNPTPDNPDNPDNPDITR
jgi:hypothetical protein